MEDFTSDALTRAIYSRLVPLGMRLSLPYKLNVLKIWIAPAPPERFRRLGDGSTLLACGYSISWDISPQHEVILGTVGRKHGASAKGPLSPATQSTLCKLLLRATIGPSRCFSQVPRLYMGGFRSQNVCKSLLWESDAA